MLLILKRLKCVNYIIKLKKKVATVPAEILTNSQFDIFNFLVAQ